MVVGDDAVVDLQPRSLGQSGVGVDTDAHDDGVRREAGAVGEQDTVGGVPVTGDLADPNAEPQVDAVIPVQVGEDLGDLPAEHPEQGQLGALQHHHPGTGRTGRGRGLQADPARADHDDRRAGPERPLEPVAVLQPPQVQHAVQVRAGNGQPAR